jgi:hypothetical protein
MAQVTHNLMKFVELFFVRQGAAEKKIDDLLKAESAVFNDTGHQVADVDAAVNEASVHRYLMPVLNVVALRRPDAGQPCEYARSVGVPQAALNVFVNVALRVYMVIFGIFYT